MVSFVPGPQDTLRFGASLAMRIAGAESNTAIGVSTYGHSSSYISRVGSDCFGQYILRMIRAEGVDVSGIIIDEAHQTGLMFKEPLPGRETAVHYYRSGSAASFLSAQDLDENLIREAEILHFTGITPILSSSCLDTIYTALEIAAASRTLISFDPNIRFKLWNGCDYKDLMLDLMHRSNVVLIGRDEAACLYGTSEVETLYGKLTANCPSLRALAVKDGANGAWAGDSSQLLFVPAADCRCVDPVGAGDAFNAGFLSGLLSGEPLEKCAAIAAISGARATETAGDIEGFIRRQEMDAILNRLSGAPLR